MGGPRKTHIPSNKALGKLSTYVRSITLTVAEAKADTVVARVFGANHVKHGLKHLCTSNKALHGPKSKKMVMPSCGAEKPAPAQTTSRAKRPPPAPGVLAERGQKKAPKCAQGPCPKKRRKQKARVSTASSPAPDVRVLTGRTEAAVTKAGAQKQKRKQRVKHKTRKQNVTTTTEPTSTTSVGISLDENLISDDDDDDDFPSTGPTAFSSNADDDYGYDN